MGKRERLEVIFDILCAVRDAGNSLGPTRLLYASNLSPKMFKEYTEEMVVKGFLAEDEVVVKKRAKKQFQLTTKGFQFLEKYQEIISVIEEFGL